MSEQYEYRPGSCRPDGGTSCASMKSFSSSVGPAGGSNKKGGAALYRISGSTSSPEAVHSLGKRLCRWMNTDPQNRWPGELILTSDTAKITLTKAGKVAGWLPVGRI